MRHRHRHPSNATSTTTPEPCGIPEQQSHAARIHSTSAERPDLLSVEQRFAFQLKLCHILDTLTSRAAFSSGPRGEVQWSSGSSWGARRRAGWPNFQFLDFTQMAFFNSEWASGNPRGASGGVLFRPGRFWATSCFDDFLLFRISCAHQTADCRPNSGAKTFLKPQKNFLLVH